MARNEIEECGIYLESMAADAADETDGLLLLLFPCCEARNDPADKNRSVLASDNRRDEPEDLAANIPPEALPHPSCRPSSQIRYGNFNSIHNEL